MKYKDLIQFEAVTEVIQLLNANHKETAAQLVSTYVISDRMADVILHRILPALRIDDDNVGRGLFIVGNYGTGKSHLMAMLSAISEHADLLERIKHPIVKKGFLSIAGKFKVVRQETSATKMALRDVVFIDLERQLRQMDVNFHFPSMEETTSNKLLLQEMMQVFSEKYPEKGLLIVLDELLDYLRSRDEKEIIIDLNFLRELGEACEILPLRFISGIQEALFDNPRFSFVGDSIKRVKSRFDQASIIREDVAFVVSNRLLNKTEAQKKIIRKHLENFTELYEDMAERLDDFIELFPIHPAYLVVFEQVSVGERRDLLKALSTEMNSMLEKDVPHHEPGLITFDSYWRMLKEDDAFRTIPDVRLVQEKAKVLSDKVQYAPETKQYRDTALRMIDGLALHRLTVSDIYAPIGITPSELRDQLCIHLPLPENDADFLLATIETILKAISRAVNGQFISHNRENDQYYLDLKKDIDYEALIEQKASTLSPNTLDRYYFDLVKWMLEINETSYVPGFRIWESEIPWVGHGVTRRGYIFLGAANERSTAHPERDFYILFHGLYGNGINNSKRRPDEVYFKLTKPDKEFEKMLRSCAGASEMSAISSGSNRDQYDAKGRQYLKKLQRWFAENFIRTYHIYHQNEEKTITEAISDHHLTLRDTPFRDQVYALSSAMLSERFNEKYPQYPKFEGIQLTQTTLLNAAENAIRAIDGGPVTHLAQCILEGLELGQMKSGSFHWAIEDSPYAIHYQLLVQGLPDQQVINRLSILHGEPGAERDEEFGLEPELFAVLLAALVKHGSISISVQHYQINEVGQDNGERLSLQQLLRFTSISKPKPVPELSVKALFENLGLQPELVDDPHTREISLSQFQSALGEALNKVVRTIENLRDGPRFAQRMILTEQERNQFRQRLDQYRQFLNNLTGIKTYARFANLNYTVREIREAFKTKEIIDDVGAIFEAMSIIRPVWEYLAQAKGMLPKDHPWQKDAQEAIDYIISTLSDSDMRHAQGIGSQLLGRLENLKANYVRSYYKLHQNARLDREQDAEKRKLVSDSRWSKLRALSSLSLLPSNELEQIQKSLEGLISCPNLQMDDMRNHTICPHCGFNPVQEDRTKNKTQTLESVRIQLETLAHKWVNVLLANLKTEEAVQNMKLLQESEREAVRAFLTQQALPEKITSGLIDGISSTLQGLEIVEIDGTEFLLALTEHGMPCTPDVMETRIRDFFQKRLEGKNRKKTRIHINW